jgi:hypothetical protein
MLTNLRWNIDRQDYAQIGEERQPDINPLTSSGKLRYTLPVHPCTRRARIAFSPIIGHHESAQ